MNRLSFVAASLFPCVLACTSEGQIFKNRREPGFAGAAGTGGGGQGGENSGGAAPSFGGADGSGAGDGTGSGASDGTGGGTLTQPGPRGDAQVSAGDQHSCAVVDGALYCWGNNAEGALGVDDVSVRLTPTRVGSQSDWAFVSCGKSHSCGLRDGKVFCWGSGSNGQLGLNSFSSVLAPSQVTLPADASQLSAGHEHTCAILSDQRLFCWGNNAEGQLAQNDPFPSPGIDSPIPVEIIPNETWRRVSAGQGHTCAIRESGALYCWGRNTTGTLGLGSAAPEQVRVPRQVGTAVDWTEIASGQGHTCGIEAGGVLSCWGENDHHQLMFDSPGPVFAPVQVMTLSGVQSVTLDTFHTCAITENGQATCSGRNVEGSLGNGANESSALMAVPVPEQGWTMLAAGRFHTCGIHEEMILCSGSNAGGELGVGDSMRRNVFTQTVYEPN